LTLKAHPYIGAPNNGRPLAALFSSIRGMINEAHLPAEQSGPQAAPRLSLADGDGRRPQGAERSPRPRTQKAQRLVILRKRSDFLAANRGTRIPTPGFVLLVRNRDDGDDALRVGFTVTKKIGNAVVRNRAKRRLRAAASQLLPLLGRGGHDYVLVARGTTVARPFPALLSDITSALKAAHKKLDAKAGEL